MPAERDWVRTAVARHEGPLLAYVSRLVGDAERSRDIVQDAFAQLCQQKESELNGRLAPWLYSVCRNRAIDLARKEQRMTALERGITGAGAKPSRDCRDPGFRVMRCWSDWPSCRRYSRKRCD